MSQAVAHHPLPGRLAALRRRWRAVTLTRGVAVVAGSFLLAVVLVGLLDWLLVFPAAIRAFFLVGILAGLGILVVKLLSEPLALAADNLSLALRVEECYPELNDGLASAIQFLETPEDRTGLGSTTVRKAAVRQAMLSAESCDFRQVVSSRGVGLALVSLLAALTLGAGFLHYQPELAHIAMWRLADPFGEHAWPAATRLVDLRAPRQLARGEPFPVTGLVEGVLPNEAVIRIQSTAGRTTEQVFPLRKREGSDRAALAARIEPDMVSKSFRYQVQANDAVTRWQEVSVLPPPLLAPLDGRPSPQTLLRYPAYTDMPPRQLADGGRLIAAVAGTRVISRAAADRPVARAWLEYEPEFPAAKLATCLAPLAAASTADAWAFSAGGQAVWGKVPARLERGNTVLTLDFVPWVSGTYALHLEDERRIGSRTRIQIGVAPDPAPKVLLERPSASRDSLALMADADFTLQLVVEDIEYAIRSVFVEYRCQKDDPLRRLQIYRHDSMGQALGGVGSAMARAALPAQRLRPGRLAVAQRLSLRQFRHLDGSGLREGDVISLVACADDFDNVAVDKQPGRSHEVELRIVNRSTLEAILHQNQAQIQQELLRLRELERKAHTDAAAILKQEQAAGKLNPEDLKRLTEILDQQKQIRDRVGDDQQGLRGEVGRALQTIRDNHLPRGGAQERLEMVERELDRLARDELEQIESLLTNARKENELRTGPRAADDPSALAQAAQHQAEVERTLEDLLARLDAWSNTRQARAESRAILQEQQKLAGQTERLPDQVPPGTAAQELTPEQRAELEKTAEGQRRLGEHASQLLQRMERMARERQAQANDKLGQAQEKERLVEDKQAEAKQARPADPARADALDEEARGLEREAAALREEAAQLQEEAQALQQAANEGRSGQLEDHMRQAAESIARNQVGNAGKEQQAGSQALERVVQALEDRREKELDALIKKLKDAEQDLARLVEEQERLQKKVQEAQGLADPKQREEQLRRLAREQERLQKKGLADPKQREEQLRRLAREQEQLRKRGQEMTRQLSRLQAERARDALGRANERMGEAGMQLERNEDAAGQQDEALDRLDEALEEVQQALEKIEEELAREKLAKVADQIKQLKERQETLLAESARIHRRVLENEGWDRIQQKNLNDLKTNQDGLKVETSNLAEGKLAGAKVFARIVKMSAEAMAEAAQSMDDRAEAARKLEAGKLDAASEQAADRRTQDLQKRALQRLDQLLDALKEEDGVAMRPRRPQQQQPMPQGQDPPQGGGAPGDAIPELAELKALRSLQQEVNQRTEEFARKHPDPAKLTEPQQIELQAIRQDQKQVHELIEEIAAPEAGPAPRPEEPKPMPKGDQR